MYLAGVGVVEGVENRRSLMPRLAGGLGLPGRELGVAEVGQDGGLGVAVAELPEQAERAPITRHGCGVIAALVLGIAQVVPALGLIAAIAEFPQQVKGTPAERPGLLGPTEVGVAPADAGQSPGLSDLIAQGLEQAQGLLAVAEHVGVAFLEIAYPGSSQMNAGLSGPVAKPAVQLEAIRQVGMGQLITAKLRLGRGHGATGGGLATDVAQTRRRVQRTALNGGQFMPVSL